MKTLRRFVSAGCATMVCTALLSAQDVQYKSVTSANFGGPLGGLMKMATKGEETNGRIEQTSYLKGRKMRHDGLKSSTIIDLDAGKMIMIEHDKKRYRELTFAEMQEMMRKAVPSSSQKQDGQGITTKFDVKIDPTGEKKTINGVDAQRYFVTTAMTFEVEGEKKPEPGKDDGGLVMLYDLWLTKDTKYRALHKANQEWSDAVGGDRSFAAIFAQYPKARDAFKRMVEEMKNLDGAPTRSTFYFVLVPTVSGFDQAKMVENEETKAAAKAAEPEKKKGGGLGGFLKKAAEASMKGKTEEKQDKPEEPVVLLRTASDFMDVQTTKLEDSLFTPPADYKNVTKD